jgi:hypothetical protein
MTIDGKETLISLGSVAFIFFLALVVTSPQGEEAERLLRRYPIKGGTKKYK